MTTKIQEQPSQIDYEKMLQRVAEAMAGYYPKAVVLFGSMARYLAGIQADPLPNDVDILYIGSMAPVDIKYTDYGMPLEVHNFQAYQVIQIAKSLRYDSKPVALAKLYSKNIAKQHAIDIIIAALLLGPTYNSFGIQQIEIDDKPDTRDYSVHKVLYGDEWWKRLSDYARNRRGPLLRFTDKIVFQSEFNE